MTVHLPFTRHHRQLHRRPPDHARQSQHPGRLGPS